MLPAYSTDGENELALNLVRPVVGRKSVYPFAAAGESENGVNRRNVGLTGALQFALAQDEVVEAHNRFLIRNFVILAPGV